MCSIIQESLPSVHNDTGVEHARDETLTNLSLKIQARKKGMLRSNPILCAVNTRTYNPHTEVNNHVLNHLSHTFKFCLAISLFRIFAKTRANAMLFWPPFVFASCSHVIPVPCFLNLPPCYSGSCPKTGKHLLGQNGTNLVAQPPPTVFRTPLIFRGPESYLALRS